MIRGYSLFKLFASKDGGSRLNSGNASIQRSKGRQFDGGNGKIDFKSFKGDSPAGQGLREDLHATMQTENGHQRGYDRKLLACEDEALLVGRDSQCGRCGNTRGCCQ